LIIYTFFKLLHDQIDNITGCDEATISTRLKEKQDS